VAGHDDEEVDAKVEGAIAVEAEDQGEEEEEEEEIKPGQVRSLYPTRFRALANSYSFAFHHPAPGRATCHHGLPFASTSHVLPRHHRDKARVRQPATGMLPGGSPTSAVSLTLSPPGSQDVRGTPMPPCHPATSGGCQHPSTAPAKSCLPNTNGRSYRNEATRNVRGASAAA
jgi:hypothetical protein